MPTHQVTARKPMSRMIGRFWMLATGQEGDVDVLDEAVVRTVLNGGEVYGIEEDDMPEYLPLAALLRDDGNASAS